MRVHAFLLALLFALLATGEAFAHASLVRAEPGEGAMLAQAPDVLKLTFNEPVSPLQMRLIGPSGDTTTPAVTSDNAVVTITPSAPLRQGTHVLSWRVISADGHPVGGALTFSVGSPSSGPPVPSQGNTLVRALLWGAKVVINVGLFVGIGGAFFRAWLGGATAAPRALVVLVVGGLVATILSVGLQGLDALDLGAVALWRPAVWEAGFATAYGMTACVAVLAMLAAIVSLLSAAAMARAWSLAGLLGIGLALTLSGHAGTVEPRALTRSAVFLHAVCVAFWIGALLPLALALRNPKGTALARFSRLIPLPLAVLVLTGGALAFVQLDRVDALWTTRYGIVLSCKLALVAALLALAAANRYVLVPRFQAQGEVAARPLAASFRIELALALVILGLVALWRFTPPPRALASASHISIHIHGPRAMAQIDIEPARGRGAQADILVLDGEVRPLAAKEVTFVMSNPAAGIEPLRRNAIQVGDSEWRIDGLRVPVAGRWRLRVEILISDFEKVTVEDDAELPRLP